MWSQFIAKIRKLRVPVWLLEKNSRLRATAITLACLVCGNFFLYFALIVPWSSTLKTKEDALTDLRRKQSVAIQFEKQKPLFAGIQGGMPTQKDMPLLVKEFMQTARKLNLAVAAVKYDIPRGATGEPTMTSFSFPVEGRYPDIKRFIHEVETSDRLVGIKAMKFTSEKGRVKLDMKLITYIKN